ncbi:collagen alpha-5(vi) chain [Plakobranchus ocellatus]|uniref:Collagen alpha-5(Vi) chain n=1 Tax=Plakobranchus ocellatus TaxID=259542 RepID=A0AAV4DYL3_9GAST|nr:collagen alpha-5(vi) chain [Plakobranchus ocellatus]
MSTARGLTETFDSCEGGNVWDSSVDTGAPPLQAELAIKSRSARRTDLKKATITERYQRTDTVVSNIFSEAMAFSASHSLLLLVTIASLPLALGNPMKKPCGKAADVVFVIDTSSSIWIVDFESFALPFIQSVVSAFNIGPGPEQTRVGAISYSSSARLQFHLNTYQDEKSVLDAIGKIRFHRGDTYTDKALRYVNNYMFLPRNGGREGVAHIVIVLTDGKSSRHSKTALQAMKAKENGISIFAIGVGYADEAELKILASQPESQFKFRVAGYQALDGIKIELALKACEVTASPMSTEITSTTTTTTTTTTPTTTSTEPPKSNCGGKPADIFFILDTSSSIRKRDFDTSVLRFVRATLSNFDIGENLTRVGVMTFSDKPHLVIPLGAHMDKQMLLDAINRRAVRYTLGGTNTGDALREIRILAKWRKNVAKIAVVLTDGQSSDEEKTREEADLLKKDGVKIYAIGVGKATKQAELETIANDPKADFVFSVDGFAALTELQEVLAITACREPVVQADQPTCGSGPTHVTFAVDSNTLSLSKKRHVISQIQSVTERLDSLDGDIRLSLKSGACAGNLDFSLTSPRKANFIMKQIKRKLQPSLHKVIQEWRKTDLSDLTEVVKKNGVTKLTKDVNYKGSNKGLVVLVNNENEAESDQILKEVLVLLDAGIEVLVLLDVSVSQYTTDKWKNALGKQRVVSGIGPDMGFSGYVMEFMCSL